MTWHGGFLLFVCLTVAPNVQAPPRTVASAEAEGAKYPKVTGGAERPASLAGAFGTRERRCVEADTHEMAQSGEFIAGPFHENYVMAGSGKRKLWWAPLQNSATMPALQFRAAKVAASDVTVNWTLPSVAHVEGGYFFNTLIRFPENGKWLVVVSSGDNWGCFLFAETQAGK